MKDKPLDQHSHVLGEHSVINLPEIEGPVPITPDSEPFRGMALPTGESRLAMHDLESGSAVVARDGYIEEEYFITGEAAGAQYRTQLLIRRPADLAKFSGVAIVETVHVAGSVPGWMFKDYLVRSGHAHIAVASQSFALERQVKESNPLRYEQLFIDVNPTPVVDPAGDLSLPSTAPGRAEIEAMVRTARAQRPVSEAIIAQVGALIKHPETSPLGDLIQCAILTGVSQTAGVVLDFMRDTHSAARLSNGAPIFDGYFPVSNPGLAPVVATGVPVVHMPNEGDFLMMGMGFGGASKDQSVFAHRREDSDAPDDRYRLYELAGCAHIPTWGVSPEDFSRSLPALAEALQPGEQLAQFPGLMYRAAALDNLIQWVRGEAIPPHADRLRISESEILRDEHQNALGGLRSSHLDIPIATYNTCAATVGAEGHVRRSQIGIEYPFTAEELNELHGTHAEYVRRVKERLLELTTQRWLLAADADILASDAEAAAEKWRSGE